ncbi:MAG: matrixin family metalloprotease [Myxococcota bacterium]
MKSKLYALLIAGASLNLGIAANPAEAYTVKRTESGDIIRWHSDLIVISISEEARAEFGTLLERAATEASYAWAGLDNVPTIEIRDRDPGPLGYHPGRSRNGIYVTSEWPFEETRLAVTISTYDQGTGRLLDTDILINGALAFTDAAAQNPTQSTLVADVQGDQPLQANAHDLEAVLTHEMGHVLGLGEDDASPTSTMYPRIAPGEVHQRTIEERDILGATEAYATMVPDDAATGCSGAHVAHSRPAPNSLLWLGAASLWIFVRMRRWLPVAVGITFVLLPQVMGGVESPGGNQIRNPSVVTMSSGHDHVAHDHFEEHLQLHGVKLH